MKHEEPYQEMVENTMFILLGNMYETQTLNRLSEHYHSVPAEYHFALKDAVQGLLYEKLIHISLETQESVNGYIEPSQFENCAECDVINPLMTQKGREWYQEQVINRQPKWEKLFEYVGKKVLDKTIASI